MFKVGRIAFGGLMSEQNECEQFIRLAQAGLVLRGYSNAKEIEDPILKEVWRLGRKLTKQDRKKASREGAGNE